MADFSYDRHFVINDEAEVYPPKLIDSHGFYVYEVDTAGRVITVPAGVHLSAKDMVELEDDELPEGVTVRPLFPRAAPAGLTSLAARAEEKGTSLEELVSKYATRLTMVEGADQFVRGSLLAMLRELETD